MLPMLQMQICIVLNSLRPSNNASKCSRMLCYAKSVLQYWSLAGDHDHEELLLRDGDQERRLATNGKSFGRQRANDGAIVVVVVDVDEALVNARVLCGDVGYCEQTLDVAVVVERKQRSRPGTDPIKLFCRKGSWGLFPN